MRSPIRIISVSITAVCLSACMFDGNNSYSPYNFGPSEPATTLYPEGYDTTQFNQQPIEKASSSGNVVVPQSYHVGMGAPQSSKDVDKSWVNSQNPESYTIEMADSDKASAVANVLYKAPKSERTAEIKTSNDHYKGLYGTYPTYEAAQEKLNSLPSDLKQNAGIKTWKQVQHDIYTPRN